jgi:hypothetical protein
MKLHTQAMNPEERMALQSKIKDALNGVVFDRAYGSNIVALDGDFLPARNINDARWLYSSNYYDYAIVRINNDGSMTQIDRE